MYRLARVAHLASFNPIHNSYMDTSHSDDIRYAPPKQADGGTQTYGQSIPTNYYLLGFSPDPRPHRFASQSSVHLRSSSEPSLRVCEGLQGLPVYRAREILLGGPRRPSASSLRYPTWSGRVARHSTARPRVWEESPRKRENAGTCYGSWGFPRRHAGHIARVIIHYCRQPCS